jgi:hypothetical protein
MGPDDPLEDPKMERHITDKPHAHDDGPRLREYLRVERESGRHPAFDALHRKPRGGSDRKVVEYTRIERGQTA